MLYNLFLNCWQNWLCCLFLKIIILIFKTFFSAFSFPSLADELLSDVMAEVAAEFQDVVEEYAEAVFTSEFLQPIQSPPALAAAVVSQ